MTSQAAIKLKLPVLNYQDPDLCRECGGACCRRIPGIAHPEDFGAPNVTALRRRVEAALASGRWAVDWWEGDPRAHSTTRNRRRLDRAYFLRPACAGDEGLLMDPSWGGTCTFLGDNGCSLDHDARPYECRDLEPTQGFNCVGHGLDKRGLAEAWIPYTSEVESIIRVLQERQRRWL